MPARFGEEETTGNEHGPEGGPLANFLAHASLEAGDQQLDFSGLYESGSFGEGRRADAVPIPNVIAVQRRVRR